MNVQKVQYVGYLVHLFGLAVPFVVASGFDLHNWQAHTRRARPRWLDANRAFQEITGSLGNCEANGRI